MTHIDEIIKRQVNPFDSIELKPSDFWEEEQDSAGMVESIHQEAIDQITELLNLVAQDHRSRTVLLHGSSGSGKSYLLGRLKRKLNSKAFFAYIFCNWSSSGYIWQHILRRTVDSLLQIPDGEKESQLMLWLQSLTAFTTMGNAKKQPILNLNFWQTLKSDRQKFIKHLKETYKKVRIYNPDAFFGVLHDLTNPDLYDIAAEWLRGDDLSEESMKLIKVKSSIDTEEGAKNILANFGKISSQTQPIVLCFDNLDTMPQLPGGFLDIQPFLNVNTSIHGDKLKNFLVIISFITNTWFRHKDRIYQADMTGIHKFIKLKDISIEQAEALWEYQLKPLHKLAHPIPKSPLFPLDRGILEENYPGGKTIPRRVLDLGRREYQRYKKTLVEGGNYRDKSQEQKYTNTSVQNGNHGNKNQDQESNSTLVESGNNGEKPDNKTEKHFLLSWQSEYKKTQTKFTKISLLSSSDLTQMLEYAICALNVPGIETKLISGKYATYSFSYIHPENNQKIGIVWTEDSNMNSFYHIMNACQTAIRDKSCHTIYLIRNGDVGKPNTSGNQVYRQIFINTNHRHLRPSLTSVHYLATYQSFVNSAKSQDLVVDGETIDLPRLEELIRELKVLHKCDLLQDLGIIEKKNVDREVNDGGNRHEVKEYIFTLLRTQQMMSVSVLISTTSSHFSDIQRGEIEQLINSLCQENKAKIIDPTCKQEEQIICWCA
jgi:hypothetical protein